MVYDEQNTCSMWILGFSHHVWKPSPPHANDRPGTMGMWLASKICNVALATTSGMSRDAAKAIQAETRKYIQWSKLANYNHKVESYWDVDLRGNIHTSRLCFNEYVQQTLKMRSKKETVSTLSVWVKVRPIINGHISTYLLQNQHIRI